jgi:hypothetical protein
MAGSSTWPNRRTAACAHTGAPAPPGPGSIATARQPAEVTHERFTGSAHLVRRRGPGLHRPAWRRPRARIGPYQGHGGPAKWAELDHDFAACKLGKVQSPIDIRGAKAADLPPIRFSYKPSPLKVIDNGHTIQVNVAPGSSIDVGDAHYELLQFHFHKPSEEKIQGKAHAMVAHLVHKSRRRASSRWSPCCSTRARPIP